MGASRCPELYTARYFAETILTSGEVVPVRASYEPPIVPLPYDLEEGPASLLVEHWMLGEWPHLSPNYWNRLDEIGAEEISCELTAISDRHGGKPLALLDYEDLVIGDRSPRIVFAAWWEEKTGQPVYELTDEGRKLHYTELAKRTQPMKPKEWAQDRRWRGDAERLQWPLTHEQVARWIEGRYFQQARSKSNPHSYSVKYWGDARNFELIVLHIRENGRQEVFGGDTYTYLVVNGYKYWTMGAPLPTTVILNRKVLGQDEGDELNNPKETATTEPNLFGGKEQG